tara:strand:- start:1254 stop:1577 length:324 start_codon:yes stop_codon:yes gene_type:complete
MSAQIPQMYKVDPNDNTKMVPKSAFQYTEAVSPAKETTVERPLYITINNEHATAYEFMYETDGGFISAGKFQADGTIRLDIQPIQWKGGAGNTGDVTFYYKRSSSGN